MSKKIKDPWVRIINVSDPILHEKGYTLYKVTSKVFPKNSVEAVTEVTVWKRYNDFKKLYKALHTIHQNLYLKGSFPPFAKARFFGRFEDSVIEERRKSALELLEFANCHPPLFTSQVFVKFFEEGHSVDGCSVPKDFHNNVKESSQSSLFNDNVNILQPQISNLLQGSSEKEIKNTISPLGGTWQHPKAADTLSLSSQCTDDDEDDRTTFTDDENTNPRPSLDLTEFDPLLSAKNVNSSLNALSSNINTVSDNWLLSALQSCSKQVPEKDSESFEFPAPFGGIESAEIATPSNENLFSAKTESGSDLHFSFDLSSTMKTKLELGEFDPLATHKPSKQDSEESFHNADDFAATPPILEKDTQITPSFILQASKYVVQAQEADTEQNYAEAFEMYKKAIDVLLLGIKGNEYPDLRDAVRKKVLLYLMRAEEIYENKLPKDNGTFKENSPYSFNSLNKISNLRGCVQDLNKYKVLGILGKVLLVLDTSDNCTYVVKALYKSSVPKTFDVPDIVPQNIPFMVKLHCIYDTSYAIFLILEHATGGRLWDYVSSYLQRSPLSPCSDGDCLFLDSKTNKGDLSNVYSGKKVAGDVTDDNSNLNFSDDYDLTPSENCPPSYLALFRKYAASMNRENNVSFAKYNQLSKVPCDRTNSLSKDHGKSCNGEDSNALHQANCSEEDSLIKNMKNQHKSSRNRLSSSTGSIETAVAQKTCLLEAFDALDKAAFDTSNKPTHLPESAICMWAAEIVVALEALHNLGIVWMDFHPENILLGAEGHILLTYQSKWNNVDFFVKESAIESLFSAPEVSNIYPVSVECDWWSLGAILFELLTGQSLVSCHPTGISHHTMLNFPSDISGEAKDFVSKLLQYNPSERLGSGIYGIEELKSHPFFHSVDWNALSSS